MSRFQLLKTIAIATFTTLLLTGCATRSTADEPPLAAMGYVNLNSLPPGSGQINNIREQALRETATMLGARGALAWRAVHIDAALEKQATYLDHLFDFNQLLLKHNVLPPVIVESQANLNLADDDTIRTADKTYKIVADARFVTAPPTWRSYLWLSYKKPDLPSATLLPKDKSEAQVWNFYLKQGWQNGLQQANEIFAANLNRLKRDYLGMVLYRKLLAQGMITSPVVAKVDLGVTGDANQIRINDEIMRITAQSALQPDSSHWNPVLTDGASSP
ncbi:type IV secretion system DotC family protein [Coxiella burnetii]|uniref:type IV secretion system DotC family protein n=1 Tax=Coxiella burnetii TaxID=777 RepID=UPI00222EB31D|nr:type IV secretion system DotC family protein [Coxiella burnetii]